MTSAAKLTKRARRNEDKEARRQVILGAAAKLFETSDYGAITMAQVAQTSGLAKGTVYLYFPSKEALFLAHFLVQLRVWLAEVDKIMGQHPTITPKTIAEDISQTLGRRPDLVRLLALLHSVLEVNLSADTARAFKSELLDMVVDAGARLEERLPSLPKGQGLRYYVRLNAFVVGLAQVAFPVGAVAEILQEPKFQPLRLDFDRGLRQAAEALLSTHLASGSARID